MDRGLDEGREEHETAEQDDARDEHAAGGEDEDDDEEDDREGAGYYGEGKDPVSWLSLVGVLCRRGGTGYLSAYQGTPRFI